MDAQGLCWELWFKLRALTSGPFLESRAVGEKVPRNTVYMGTYMEADYIHS